MSDSKIKTTTPSLAYLNGEANAEVTDPALKEKLARIAKKLPTKPQKVGDDRELLTLTRTPDGTSDTGLGTDGLDRHGAKIEPAPNLFGFPATLAPARPADLLQPPPASPADEVRATAAYTNATPQEKAAIDSIITRMSSAPGTPEDLAALKRILSSPFWGSADSTAKGEALRVLGGIALGNLDTGGVEQGRGVTRPTTALAEMSEAQLNGRPMLLDRASGGATLVHHLADASSRLEAGAATNPILQQGGFTPAQVLGGLILEVNDSGRIGQSNVGTCTMTTLQIMLVEQQPAEYVRLVTDLVVDGHARGRSGKTFERDTSSLAPTPGNSRTPTERVFQSALMEYASNADYQVRVNNGDVTDVQSGHVIDTLPTWLKILSWILILPGLVMTLWPLDAGGANSWEIDDTAEALFGEEWKARYASAAGLADLSMPHSGASEIGFLLERHPDGDLSSDRVGVSLDWSSPGVSGYHFLQVTHVDPPGSPEPRLVYMHNPWGSHKYGQVGQQVGGGAPPGVVWIDPQRGIVGMTIDDFQSRVQELNYSESVPAATP